MSESNDVYEHELTEEEFEAEFKQLVDDLFSRLLNTNLTLKRCDEHVERRTGWSLTRWKNYYRHQGSSVLKRLK